MKQYDFASMTKEQFLAAARDLGAKFRTAEKEFFEFLIAAEPFENIWADADNPAALYETFLKDCHICDVRQYQEYKKGRAKVNELIGTGELPATASDVSVHVVREVAKVWPERGSPEKSAIVTKSLIQACLNHQDAQAIPTPARTAGRFRAEAVKEYNNNHNIKTPPVASRERLMAENAKLKEENTALRQRVAELEQQLQDTGVGFVSSHPITPSA